MIRLRTRIMLTFGVFFCLAVATLSFVSNHFASRLFANLVQENIEAQSTAIVESVSQQYNTAVGAFNPMTLMALGMNYAHQGFIISVKDTQGVILWDARECDMELCVNTIQEIESRMAEHRLKGETQTKQYPLLVGNETIGSVSIETFGPFFYSKAESSFIQALRNLLLFTGIVFLVLTIPISIFLANTIAKPIREASNTATQIASGDFAVRMNTNQKTAELKELTESVNNLAIALEKGEQWQKRLTSDIAHELRTPLTTLQGNMEAMIDQIWEPTPEHLASCHEEIVRLTGLVNDLNLISIFEQQNLLLQKKEFDLTKLCNDVILQLAPMMQGKKVQLVSSSPPLLITADYYRMKQVFLNLISNAIRYTDKGTIEIVLAKKENTAHITVTDTGCGIDEKDLPHIFERFYRSDKSRNRDTGGSGIGLTITKAIVTAHGGEITATSQVEKGTCFEITLPIC